MVEPQLMMMAISGLVLNKNTLSWTQTLSSVYGGYPAPQECITAQ
jgi:hypothetical protein